MANLIPYTKSPIIKSQKSAIIKADKFLNAKSTKVNTNSVKSKQSKDPSEDIILQIEKKVIKIDKLLKDSFALKKKQQKKSRIKEEQKEFENREKELEKKKPKKEKGVNLPTPPKMGFIDWIKNFVFNTILGFLTVRLLKFLPTLLKIYPVIIGAGEFLINVGGNLLNSLVSFVDWGYKAVDATSGFIKSIGGEGLSKVFDNFMGAIDNVLEFAVMAALVSSGGDDESGGLGGKGGRKGFDSQGRRVGKNVQQRYARRFGKDQFVDRFGTKNVKNVAQGARRGGLQQGARNAFVGVAGKGGAKSILKFVRPLTNKLPIIGGLLNFGLSVALGEDPGRAAFKAIGSTLVGALGAAIGSLAFGVGGIIGGIIGGIGGDALGGALYDMFFKGKKPKPKQGKANKLAGGGSPIPSTRGGKSVSSAPKRTLKKKKSTRTLTFTPRKIQPGRSTGGEAKVQSVFPNPEKKAWWDPLGVFTGKKQEQEQQPQQKKPKGKSANPQEFLIKSNDIFGRAKGTAGKMISGFATYIIKSLLGDVPDDLDYLNLSKGLNSFMQGIFQPGTLGFSGGGEVDARQFFDGKDYTKVIAKSVKESGSKEVDTIVRNLRNEMSLRPVGRDEMLQENIRRGTDAQDMGEGAGVQVSSDSEDFWLLATAAMFENSNPQGSADVAQVIYNRTQYPAWNASTIRKAILNPGQFQPVRQYGGTAAWASIKTKQDALRFSKSHGKTQEQLERVAAALLDKQKQQDAKQFVGPRDSFRSDAYEKANNHLANDTEKSRHGHTFGFEPGGAMIGKFKAGQLSAAQVNASIKGDITQSDSKLGPGSKEWRFGRTGRMSVAPGWSHAHFDAENESSLIRDMIPLLKKMASSGLKPELANGTPILSGKDNEYYSSIVRSGISQHTHRPGPRMDVNMPGFPLIPFPLKYSFYQAGGAGHSAVVPGSGKTLLFHMSKKSDGSAFEGENFGIAPFDGFMLKLHKGEIYKVVDKDSVDLFGFDLTKEIIDIENKSQLIAKAPSIIKNLEAISGISRYTDDSMMKEYIFVPVPSPPEILPIGSGSPTILIAGGVNSTNDSIRDTFTYTG